MLQFKDVSFSYSKDDYVIKNINFSIKPGEFVGLIGHSGIGKSTILKLALGLLKPSGGKVSYFGIESYEAKKRIPFAMMLQEDSLLPHLNVFDNVRLGAHIGSFALSPIESEKKTIAMLELVGITNNLWGRYPDELSGGQIQRVSLARTLNGREKMVLGLDEPFASVDMLTREILYHRLEKVFANLYPKPSVFMITHSISEAVFLCDKIIILSGHPAEIAEIVKIPLSKPRDRKKEQSLFDIRQSIKQKLMMYQKDGHDSV